MPTAPTQTPAQAAAKARQANLAARAAVLLNSVEMVQQIFSNSFDPTTQNVVNITPRNVGLIKGFLIKVTGTLATGNTGSATRTELGAANLLSNITFNDLNNNVRHNTPGWHVALLNSARMGFGYGGAYAPNLPIDFGNNWTVQSAPTPIATASTQSVSYYYYLPLAYSNDDLSGSIYAGVINATMNLQLTINKTPIIASGDSVGAVYTGNTTITPGGWNTGASCTITVFQVFLDQLPEINGQPVLPPLDLQTIYGLNQTTFTGLVTAQDFPIPYANFRNFLSTFVIFDNNGTFNVGSDVNYWSLQAANTTNIFKYGPNEAALFARYKFMADPPKGVYYFDSSRSPINTNQYGNMNLILNSAGSVTSASLLVGWEQLYNVNQITGAASLPASAM
jgi:hypothetical protein